MESATRHDGRCRGKEHEGSVGDDQDTKTGRGGRPRGEERRSHDRYDRADRAREALGEPNHNTARVKERRREEQSATCPLYKNDSAQRQTCLVLWPSPPPIPSIFSSFLPNLPLKIHAPPLIPLAYQAKPPPPPPPPRPVPIPIHAIPFFGGTRPPRPERYNITNEERGFPHYGPALESRVGVRRSDSERLSYLFIERG